MGITVFVPAIISVSKNSLSKLLNIYSHLFSQWFTFLCGHLPGLMKSLITFAT